MTVLRSVLKPVLSSVLRSVLGGPVTRYITNLDSSLLQRYAFAETLLSGTSITLTVYPTNGTLGLPPGAPAVTNNKWQTISYTTTGNVDDLGFDGVNYFNGRIWDFSAPSISVALALGENFSLTTTAKNTLDLSGLTDATAINITDSDFNTEQDNGDWLGVELVVNGGFDTDSDWNKGVGWTISGGVANCDGTQAGSSNLSQGGSLTVGDLVLITVSVSGYVAGQLSISAGAVPRFHITANGDYQFTQIVNSQTTFYLIADVDFIGSVSIVSVKQLLEKA